MTLGTSRLGTYQLGTSGGSPGGNYIGAPLGTWQLGAGGGSGSTVNVAYVQSEIQTTQSTVSGASVTGVGVSTGIRAVSSGKPASATWGLSFSGVSSSPTGSSASSVDSSVVASSSVSELAANASSLPVKTGLSAYYEASDFANTTWDDRSGNGNHLTVFGSPTKITTSTGQSAVRFDGLDDKAVLTTLTGFPSANEARSIFVAVRYNGPGWGGATWGTGSTNNVFGVGLDGDGELAIQGWGSGNDKLTNIYAPDLGWITHSATLDGSWKHYLDGAQIGTGSHTYNTTLDSFIIGAEIDQNPHVEMDVAAIAVYNREVTEDERLLIEDYLRQKFIESRESVASATPESSDLVVIGSVEASLAFAEAELESIAPTVTAVGVFAASDTVGTAAPESSVALSVDSVTATTLEASGESVASTVTGVTSAYTAPAIARGTPAKASIFAVDDVVSRTVRTTASTLSSSTVCVADSVGTIPSAAASSVTSLVLGKGFTTVDPTTSTGTPEPGSVVGIATVISPRAVLYVTVLGGETLSVVPITANLASAQVVPLEGRMELLFERRSTGGTNKFLLDGRNRNIFIKK